MRCSVCGRSAKHRRNCIKVVTLPIDFVVYNFYVPLVICILVFFFNLLIPHIIQEIEKHLAVILWHTEIVVGMDRPLLFWYQPLIRRLQCHSEGTEEAAVDIAIS